MHCMSHVTVLQAASELQIGLRTGYCGSLTTFASWQYSLVTSLIGGATPESSPCIFSIMLCLLQVRIEWPRPVYCPAVVRGSW